MATCNSLLACSLKTCVLQEVRNHVAEVVLGVARGLSKYVTPSSCLHAAMASCTARAVLSPLTSGAYAQQEGRTQGTTYELKQLFRHGEL